jgi:ABC-type transport system involved in multi-copper enzyme maturation permease subunit
VIGRPVIQREFVGLLRTRRSSVVLIGLAVAMSSLVVARWPSDGLVDLSGQQSLQTFRVIAFGLVAAVALLVPVFPATSIVQEKRRNTLGLLLNSSLRPSDIFLGKLVATLGFVALLLLVTLPAVSACHALGGLSFNDNILWLYVVLVMASLEFAAWALLVSSLATTTDGAMRATFGGVLLLTILSLIPHYFLEGSEGTLASLATHFRTLSPIPSVLQLAGQLDPGSIGLLTQVDHVTDFLTSSFVIFCLCSALTIRQLASPLLDRSRSAGTMTNDQPTGIKVLRRLFYLVDPQRRSAGIPSFVNPILVKEFQCRQFGRSHWLLRLIAGCGLISLTLAYATTLGSSEWGVEKIGAIIITMQVGLIAVFAPGISAGLISSERESGGWDQLRATPLSSGAIVRGKLLSVAWTLILLLMATLPGYGVMIWIKPVLREQIQQIMISLALAMLFAAMLSAAVSSCFRRTAPATVTSYLLLSALWGGSLMIWLGRDSIFGFDFVRSALAINPLAAALSINRSPGFAVYNLVPINWWLMSGGSLLCFLFLSIQTRRLSRPE